MAASEAMIRGAIEAKRLLELFYDGYRRIVEPHVLGVRGYEHCLLTYQVAGGTSSGGLPNWRLLPLRGIHGLRVLEDTFRGKRLCPSGKHTRFDWCIAIVR